MAEQGPVVAALSTTTRTLLQTPYGPAHPHLVEPELAVSSFRSFASPARSMAPTVAQTWREEPKPPWVRSVALFLQDMRKVIVIRASFREKNVFLCTLFPAPRGAVVSDPLFA